MKKIYWVSVIMLSVCVLTLCLGIPDSFGQRAERPVTAAPPQPPTSPPTARGLGINVWTDKGNQNPTYYVGERIYISFSVNKDSYLVLYSIDSTGGVNILFPNPYHPDNFVRKGRIYTLPDAYYRQELFIRGPSGQEALFAVASTYTYYHWQYSNSPPPIWLNEWGVYSAWEHFGSSDQNLSSRQSQTRRWQFQAQGDNLTELTLKYIKKRSDEIGKMYPLTYTDCKFFVTFSPYQAPE